jgi:membrane protease YdiL (CAAX protease family)
VAAVLFGLWHVAPALTAAEAAALPDGAVWAAVAGTVLFTAASGVGLSWLRHRTGSLLPPMAVHLATNSLGVALLCYVAQA